MVGLGNPGAGYQWNRHNVGFLFLDHLARIAQPTGWNGRKKFNGELMETRLAGRRVYLFKPLSFMNLSGGPALRAAGFYKIPPRRVAVCYDDVALPFGSLRVRAKGSAGGQNGMKDIIKAFGTDAVSRLRFGIDGARGRRSLADYVLSDFTADEKRRLDEVFDHSRGALECLLRDGAEKAASRFNRTEKPEETK